MKVVEFTAKCPFEIGDKILEDGSEKYSTITDIACINYVKTGITEFRYELDNSRKYRLMQIPENLKNRIEGETT